ncbi:MAG: UMP kinase [Euryarchaeota archaeon]|nr:UMP kinase [Euryarchaeota archaeon]
MERVVISLGGSIIIPGKQDGEFLMHFASLVKDLSREFELLIVCGGGKTARTYINVGRELNASEEQLDELGISSTRLNARLLQLALGDLADQYIPHTVAEAVERVGRGKIIIMGGTTPGHTTDGVSAALAEAVGASRIINATSVDAVYSADPNKNKTAERYDKLSFQQLEDILGSKHGAGVSGVFDPMGASIVKRCQIPLMIVAGRDLEEMSRAIRNLPIKGTVIS